MVTMMTVLLTGFLTCLAIIVAIGPQSAWLLRQGLRRDRVVLAVACCLVGDALLITAGTAGVGVVLDYAPWLLETVRWVGVAYLTWFAYRSFRSAFAIRAAQKHDDDGGRTGTGTGHGKPDPAQASDSGTTSNSGKTPNAGKTHDSATMVHVAMTSEIPVISAAEAQHPTAATKQKIEVTQVSKISAVAGTALTLSVINPHAWVDSLVVLGTMANSFGDQRWFFAVGAFVACIVWHAVVAGGGSALAGWLNRPRTWQVIDFSVGITILIVAAVLALSGF